MATTTTNFGWDIPQSTDLVKDGATAIAALGQDIDTAFVDLKGGTSGQVLTKNSGSDLDFVWATASSGSATLLDTVNLTSGNSQSSASISSSYDNLIIYIENFYASGGSANVALRFNSDSGSNYTSAGIRNSSSGSPAAVGNSAADRAYFIDQTEANQTNNFAIVYVPNYDAGTIKTFYGNATFKDSQYFTKNFNAVWNSTAAITTIQFVTSGTWVAGTAKIYGVNR